MTPEGKVKEKVKAILKSHGVYYFMPRGTAFGRGGIPDFICCCNSKFIAIETKAGRNKLTALQEKERNDIEECVGLHFVVTEDPADLAHLDKFIRGVAEGRFHAPEKEALENKIGNLRR